MRMTPSSAEVRATIVTELRRDLYGPDSADTAYHDEVLDTAPSRWYLTGFLVPKNAPLEQRQGSAETEGDLDGGDAGGTGEDAGTPDRASRRRSWRPSTLGLTALLPRDARILTATVTWGDYRLPPEREPTPGGGPESVVAGESPRERWHREHRSESVRIDIEADGRARHKVPDSDGLVLHVLRRPASISTLNGRNPRAENVASISVYLVNERDAIVDVRRGDEAFAFQAHLELASEDGFVPRRSLHGLQSSDWDERIADLHYRDLAEYAVGHNTSADWERSVEACTRVATCCMPLAAVPRVVPNESINDFELGMERLGTLANASEAPALLSGGVAAYRAWIESQRASIDALGAARGETAEQLLRDASVAADRIERGIASLSKPYALEAFAIANRSVARAYRRRIASLRLIAEDAVTAPRWRPFQLAFILLNLQGIVEPEHADREAVDLLFFPTGGGKTEAYLGLAAFTIAYRRLSHPGLTGSGLSVLMRYTLRLLTLDQLSRAAGVVCALEIERLADPAPTKQLGDWPIEIGLWVGRAATPNRMGNSKKADPSHVTARMKVLDYAKDSKHRPLPIPLRECPWCGTPFTRDSFTLVGADGKVNTADPIDLKLHCVNRECDFYLARRALPIVTVDDAIYRRLPAFLIGTVDKFAGMPWTGEIASFFGGVTHYGTAGFYGAADPRAGSPLPAPLQPPDLVIQDELHLISGPLGTMVGLYEAAIDHLCTRRIGDRLIRPKIVASTATVRKARTQIQALFDRRTTHVFPAPGPNRRDSFFAQELPIDDTGSRQYVGLAVPGGSPKVLFLRAAVSAMAAANTIWRQSPLNPENPADPYMTLLAYFNALRELGGARRIVEEEIAPRLARYDNRKRVDTPAPFIARDIKSQPIELTSRVATDEVAEAKRRLAAPYLGRKDKDSVDVALATNMISVGLDITRLGLMLVSGQPKTASEYIQTTSRVGRDKDKPGLVIVLLNVGKPRDRSHYERFANFHAGFYRDVEATSVTPFSPRALDRGLAAVAVALARLGDPTFTRNTGASLANVHRGDLDRVADVLAARAGSHAHFEDPAERARVVARTRGAVTTILDHWAKISRTVTEANGEDSLGYDKGAVARHLLYDVLDPAQLDADWDTFRVPRSLRDVEPPVLVTMKTPEGRSLNDEA
jgi:hypothetical protein